MRLVELNFSQSFDIFSCGTLLKLMGKYELGDSIIKWILADWASIGKLYWLAHQNHFERRSQWQPHGLWLCFSLHYPPVRNNLEESIKSCLSHVWISQNKNCPTVQGNNDPQRSLEAWPNNLHLNRWNLTQINTSPVCG